MIEIYILIFPLLGVFFLRLLHIFYNMTIENGDFLLKMNLLKG